MLKAQACLKVEPVDICECGTKPEGGSQGQVITHWTIAIRRVRNMSNSSTSRDRASTMGWREKQITEYGKYKEWCDLCHTTKSSRDSNRKMIVSCADRKFVFWIGDACIELMKERIKIRRGSDRSNRSLAETSVHANRQTLSAPEKLVSTTLLRQPGFYSVAPFCIWSLIVFLI